MIPIRKFVKNKSERERTKLLKCIVLCFFCLPKVFKDSLFEKYAKLHFDRVKKVNMSSLVNDLRNLLFYYPFSTTFVAALIIICKLSFFASERNLWPKKVLLLKARILTRAFFCKLFQNKRDFGRIQYAITQ